jgi:hypothetical protein
MMPDDFRCPEVDQSKDSHFASYMAVVGDRTVWNATQPRSRGDIKDGASNTISLVEIADSDISWTEPRDLDFETLSFTINADPHGPSSHHKDGINALFCGGSTVSMGGTRDLETGRVGILHNDIAPAELRALLTIDAGDTVPDLRY